MRACVRSAAAVRHATCHCGRRIIANDLRKVVSHEAPECEWFKELVASAGKTERSVEVLDIETGAVDPGTVKGGDA